MATTNDDRALAAAQKLDRQYEEAHAFDNRSTPQAGTYSWQHQLCILIEVTVQFEQAAEDYNGAPREEWDTPYLRKCWVEDMMLADEARELRRAALDHRGRP